MKYWHLDKKTRQSVKIIYGIVRLCLGIATTLSHVHVAFADDAFVHPGLLQSSNDLERIRMAVGAKLEPVYSGYEVFRADKQSQLDYRMRGPRKIVGRGPGLAQSEYDSDANAAYQCALMWCITGDIAYADKSKAILNAWSSTLQSVIGRDAVLMAGLGPFKMVNAAEIIRYTGAGWSPAEIQQTEKHFRDVIYPVIQDFAPFANGNWDTAAMKTMLAIGVFCNDRAMFERALRYYVNGAGDGRLTHYIINSTGQCQESGRDQGHTQLGLAHLGDCCEIAWHQGLDLYGYDDNLLLKGFEYTARYNFGDTVPFVETLDRTGNYHHTMIATKGRGGFRAIFEEIYNHYVNRAGLSSPSLKQVVERIRPEGSGGSAADHMGFGTLLFAQPNSSAAIPRSQTSPAAPGAVIAKVAPQENRLKWIASVGAESYTVKSATKNGAYEIIARNIADSSYTDRDVQPGELYDYEVTAVNAAGESPNSYPTSICAGLPAPWAHQDLGAVAIAGGVDFDGKVFTLEGAGAGVVGTDDQSQFAFESIDDDCTIVARYVPQTSSQSSQLGLMYRSEPAADAANVALLLDADPTAGRGWNARLTSRPSVGANTVVHQVSPNLAEPIVTNGRLTGFCWLKLVRTGDTFTGSISSDGITWTPAGTAKVPLKQQLSVGLCAASRLARVTTAVKFDTVTVVNPAHSTSNTANQIQSPDGKVTVNFFLQPGGVPAYSIEYLNHPIVLESRLGLLPDLTNGFEIKTITRRSNQGEWSPVYGERKVIPDNYVELNVELQKASGRRLCLNFRAYDEGAALRYSLPQQEVQEFHFTGEHTEFHFPGNTFGYEEHGTEGEYHRVNVADIKPWCERPLTLEYASGHFASLGEAANENYPRMLLSPAPGTADTLVSALGGTTSNTAENLSPGDPTATMRAGESTPWRMFVLGEKPGDLLERNYLMLNLNHPLALKDVSWIQPGKVMRDTALTTVNSKAIIDFASQAGLQYVGLDLGALESGEATVIASKRAGSLDLPEIIRYGNGKNVGVILYADRAVIQRQRDKAFALYEKWGLKGLKIGFVDVGPQKDAAWITETIRKAAEHHLMLDLHDGFRPTGLARTYPNLMTVEGIRGNEHFPTPDHNCTLPFTRYIAGSADYTICYYDRRLKTSRAHQLAMAVVSYSPLQFVFWYDKPSDYRGEPEVEFFRRVPTVWDDTKVINGEIGKFATIARRSGEDWFIGTINGGDPRQLKLPLTFLTPGRSYIAHIYSDVSRTRVAVESCPVDSLKTLDVPLKAAGGQAVWITPAQPKAEQ